VTYILKQNFWKTILWATLLVGSLDIIIAMVSFYGRTGKDPQIVPLVYSPRLSWQRSVFGRCYYVFIGPGTSFCGRFYMDLLFFGVYPKLNFLSASRLFTGILDGIFIWFIMSHVVVPASRAFVGIFKIKEAATGASY
jgi:hypothetical protein